MKIFRHLTAGLKGLVRRDRTESELNEELNAYLQNAAEAKVQAGATPEEALRSARLELGGMETVKHEVRAVGWEFALEVFMQDVRYGVRMLRQVATVHSRRRDGHCRRDWRQHGHVQPGRCNLTSAFALSRSPAPHCCGDEPARRVGMSPMGTADFLAWRDRQQTFEQVAVLDGAGGSFALSGMGAPERIPGVGREREFLFDLWRCPAQRTWISSRGRPSRRARSGCNQRAVLAGPSGFRSRRTEPHAYARWQVAYDRRRNASRFPISLAQRRSMSGRFAR